jgi:hypothetical protein
MQYTSQKTRFSRCRKFRYSLERSWCGGQGQILFIGLNPSTADHEWDDPTIRRCVRFARDWGFNSMAIVNLFAFRSTDPALLKLLPDPIGPRNDYWIKRYHSAAQLSVACWGNEGSLRQRASSVSAALGELYCIKHNDSRQPAHPLYLGAERRPIPWVALPAGRLESTTAPAYPAASAALSAGLIQ